MPYAEAIASTAPTSRTCASAWRLQDLSRRSPTSAFAAFRDAIDAGGDVRGFVVPARRDIRARSSTSSSTQAKQLGARGGLGAAPRRGVQSSALKAAGEDVIRRALELAGAGPAICC